MFKSLKLFLLITSFTSTAIYAQNWLSSDGTPWKNTSGQCYRSSNWTPATADPNCDGFIAKEYKLVEPIKQPIIAKPASISHPIVQPKAQPIKVEKITLATDTAFDFDKSILKVEAKKKIDLLLKNVSVPKIENIKIIGHTDSIGTDSYNDRLSVRRADSVKAYLISNGIKPQVISSIGMGKRNPIESNKSANGRAKNRRVEITINSTK